MTPTPPRRRSIKERLQNPDPADAEASAEVDDEDGADDLAGDEAEEGEEGIRLADPLFGYLVAVALSLGLTPLAAETRYAIVWTLLLIAGVGYYLFSDRARPEDAQPGNLAWGVGFGLLIGVPVLLLLTPALAVTSHQLFSEMSDASTYLALVFAIPVGETLFFRGALQETRGFRFAAVAASVWSVLLFVPNRLLAEAIAISITLVGLSFAYTYVRQRNGLAAAWACQVVINVCLLFAPRLM